eukprot:PhM_4_TR15207/c1_g2_i1/m.52428
MRFFNCAIIPKRHITVAPKMTFFLCPSLFSTSITASSMPTSAVAAAWHSTSNNNIIINNGSGHNTSTTLEDHLAELSEHGLSTRAMKMLRQAVAVHCDTKGFDAIVESVYSAVSSTATATDGDGPGMSLAEFRELVASCRADAPAVQQLLATLNYDQRASLESLSIGKMQQQFGTKFPAVCRHWLFVALVWDGRQLKEEDHATENAAAKKQQQRQGASDDITAGTHAPDSNDTTSTQTESPPSIQCAREPHQHEHAVKQQGRGQERQGASDD